MLKKALISLFILIIYLSSCLYIYSSSETSNNKKVLTANNITKITSKKNIKEITPDNEIIGVLQIDKLNLINNIYQINSKHNNVEENVTLLKSNNNLIVLAAHSGPGKIAYFNNLDKLELNDIVNLTSKKEKQTYKVIKIEEQIKDGTIEINKTNNKRLILTTCSKKSKNKQLVITTEIIKKEEI